MALILCYHAVSRTWPHALAVTQTDIQRQLELLLRRGLRGRDIDSVLAGDPQTLHVTFDDAYQSVNDVLPILERAGVGATVFACPDYADDGRPLDVAELSAEALRYPDELSTMGWAELTALAERGVEIGSHTLSHPHLRTLEDSALERELRASRLKIEAELQRPCRFLAYPYGEHDDRVRTAARAAGYEAAFALEDGGNDLFAIQRVGVYRGHAPWRVAAKASRVGRAIAARRARQRG